MTSNKCYTLPLKVTCSTLIAPLLNPNNNFPSKLLLFVLSTLVSLKVTAIVPPQVTPTTTWVGLKIFEMLLSNE